MGLMDWTRELDESGRLDNVGGVRGGLLGVGSLLTGIGAGMGRGADTSLARGFAVGTESMNRTITEARDFMEEKDFKRYAAEQAKGAAPGSRERQLWEAASHGKAGDRYGQLLPSLWRAEAADARTAASGGGTPTMRGRDQQTLAARRLLIQNPKLFERAMELDNPNSLYNLARRPLITEPDPEFDRIFSWLARGQISKNADTPYEQWGLLDEASGTYGRVQLPNADDNEAGPVKPEEPGVIRNVIDTVKDFVGFGADEEAATSEVPRANEANYDVDGALQSDLARALGQSQGGEPGGLISYDPGFATRDPGFTTPDRPSGNKRRSLDARERKLTKFGYNLPGQPGYVSPGGKIAGTARSMWEWVEERPRRFEERANSRPNLPTGRGY